MKDESNQDYLDKYQDQLKEWSSRVESVRSNIDSLDTDNFTESLNQVESWKVKELALMKKIENLRREYKTFGSGDYNSFGYVALKSDIQNVWSRLRAFKRVQKIRSDEFLQ